MANNYELQPINRPEMTDEYSLRPDTTGLVIEQTRVVPEPAVDAVASTRNGTFLRRNMMRETYSSTYQKALESDRAIAEIVSDMQWSIHEFRILLYQSMLYTNGLIVEIQPATTEETINTAEPSLVVTSSSIETPLVRVFDNSTVPLINETNREENVETVSRENISEQISFLSQQIALQQQEIASLRTLVEHSQNGNSYASPEKIVIFKERTVSTYSEKKAILDEMMNKDVSALAPDEIEELKQAFSDKDKNGQVLRGAAQISHAYKKYQAILNKRVRPLGQQNVSGIMIRINDTDHAEENINGRHTPSASSELNLV